MKLQQRLDNYINHNCSFAQSFESHRKSYSSFLDFRAHVASWVITLEKYSTYRGEFSAKTRSLYSYENDFSGIAWRINLGNVYELHIRPIAIDSTYHIRATLEAKIYPYRDFDTNELVFSFDPAPAIELADMILETFDGLAIADWWPTERTTYLNWLAHDKPTWKNGPPPVWPNEKKSN